MLVACGGGDKPPVEPPQNGYDATGLYYVKISGEGEPIAYSVAKGTSTAAVLTIPALFQGYPVKVIAAEGFMDYAELTQITIPTSIETIGLRAFLNCVSLEIVYVNRSATNGITKLETDTNDIAMGISVFTGCVWLDDIFVPENSVNAYRADEDWSVYYGRIKARP